MNIFLGYQVIMKFKLGGDIGIKVILSTFYSSFLYINVVQKTQHYFDNGSTCVH